ncbi:MAG: DUF1439 domain-containing protein [Pseudacidovorax sp.]|uniref:DUF1439 domain-containing protein n=1 Tax=Pseudacidovorax sp. TaxID=1934311 RepID=UPI001B5D7DE1|nr:DUF1439 domain-containing protein [Pseudacidovorax sp.]MBP6894396.1 DUF1439 domain-containing protein [Pseudacidovorax sp.]
MTHPDLAARRRLLASGGALLLLGAVPLRSAWAGFNFFTSEYTASREELQAQVAKKFPLRQSAGGLLDVTLRDPRLDLDPGANRAMLTTAVTIASPFLNPSQVGGQVAVSSMLRYDPETLSLRLDQPRAERVVFDGVAGQDAVRLQRAGAAVAQELLQGQALHTFRKEDLTVGRKTYEIGDITMLADGIKVQLR